MENIDQNIIEEQQKLHHHIEAFCIKLPSIQILEKCSKDLSSDINRSWNVAESVITKIKNLDKTRNRVQSCLRKVENLVNLKYCTAGVKEAMKNLEYEKAATHINQYLSLDTSFIEHNLSQNDMKNDLKGNIELLNRCRLELRQVINQKFEAAIIENDRADIERYFKIYPQIQEQKDGLRRFVQYLAKEFNTLNLKIPSNISFSQQFTLLFENSVKMMETNQLLIESFYGKGNVIYLFDAIQTECDKRVDQITKNLYENLKIKEKIHMISDDIYVSKLNKPEEISEKLLDLKNIDTIIEEIVLCLTQAQYYMKFLETVITNDQVTSSTEGQQNDIKISSHILYKPITDSGLNGNVQRFLADYIQLENYYMIKSYHKAENLNHVLKSENEAYPISSLVDDTFYIIQKSLNRAIATMHLDGICAILNHGATLFENDFMKHKLSFGTLGGIFTKNSQFAKSSQQIATATRVVGNVLVDLSHAAYTSLVSPSVNQTPDQLQSIDSFNVIGGGGGGFPDSSSAALMNINNNNNLSTSTALVSDPDQCLLNHMIKLNDIELTLRYLLKLKRDLEFESKFALDFQRNTTQARDKFKNCLSNFTLCDKLLQSNLQKGLKILNDDVLKIRVKPLIESFAKMNYILNEAEFATAETNDPWLTSLMMELQSILVSKIKMNLSSVLFDRLLTFFATDISIFLENVVLKTKFNRLGALLYDRQLRQILSFFTSLSSTWGTRDKFSRLNQINIVLNVEDVNELNDMCNSTSNSITWKLTKHDVGQFLNLRIDIDKQDIQKLIN